MVNKALSILRRFSRLGTATLMAAFLAQGCQPEPASDATHEQCLPSCDGRECGDDGCGGECGTCNGDADCSVDGLCTPIGPDGGCQGSCEELGFECGEACGESCGECTGEQEGCIGNFCQCLAACDAASCETADGCGGQCGPCANAANCQDCPLQLSLVDQVVVDGLLTELTLALDYLPQDGKPLPTMADIRLAVTGPAQLKQVGLGPPVTEADKSLFVSPETGKPFLVLDDGVHQILVFSTGNTIAIEPGRWLLLRFKMGPASSAETLNWDAAPATFALVTRDETLAPPGADSTLWGGGYDAPVVVWAQASEVNDEL